MTTSTTTNHSPEAAFAALIEAQSRPHVAIIWRGENVVFLEEHPDVKAATTALLGGLRTLEDFNGVSSHIRAA